MASREVARASVFSVNFTARTGMTIHPPISPKLVKRSPWHAVHDRRCQGAGTLQRTLRSKRRAKLCELGLVSLFLMQYHTAFTVGSTSFVVNRATTMQAVTISVMLL